MSPLLKLLKFKKSLASVLMCALVLIGPVNIITRQSQASNNSLPRLSDSSVEESAADTGPQAGLMLAAPVTSNALTPHPLSIVFDPALTRETSGNGNGILEPGESGEIGFRVSNFSDRDVGAVEVDITDDSYNLNFTGYYYFEGGTGAVFAPYEDKTLYAPFDINPGGCGGYYSPISVVIHWILLSPYHGSGVDTGSGSVSIDYIYNVNTKTFSYSGPPELIPDNSEGGVNLYLDVSGMQTIADLDFIINGSSCTSTPGSPTVGLDHANVHDLVLKLTSPQGTTVTLIDRPGDETNAGSNFCNMVLDDNQFNPLIQSITTGGAPYSGTFAPASPLSVFNGEDPNGTWVLSVSDQAAANTGQVNAFSLVIFDATPDCYQDVAPFIGGRVTTDGTTPLSDVMMSLSGAATYTSLTDENGYYDLNYWELHSGSYTVTPHKLGYLFNPVNRYFSVLDIDAMADFIATEANFSLSGRVVIAGTSIGLGGVTVNLTGDRTATVTTDANGSYTFAGLPAGGDYTVTPFMIGYKFTSAARSYSNLSANQANQNFAARMQAYTVGGTVRLGTARLEGVTITLSSPTPAGFAPRTAITNSYGTYSFTGLPAGRNYTVTAAKTGYQLLPVSHSLTNLSANQTTTDFAVKVYSVSGLVNLGVAGAGGVTLTLSSPAPAGFAARTVLTNSAGAYSFTNVPAGRNYTLTATKVGYQFTPTSRALLNLSADQTTINFLVKAHSITGRITRTGTNVGLSAVTVTLASPTPAGFAPRSVQTNSTGVYSFTSVPAGRNYTIKPVKSGFTFTPTTHTITNLSGNIGAGSLTNFTGAGP